MCSSNLAFEGLVLRSLRASPLLKPFLTPGGWQESKCVYWIKLQTKQDLLASMTIGHDFPGKVSHCNTFFSRARSTLGRRRNIIAKEAKPGSKIGFSPAPDLQQMPRLLKPFGQTKSFCHFQQGSFSFFFGKIVLFLSFLSRFFPFLYPRTFFCF